jgi:hypothetical protein
MPDGMYLTEIVFIVQLRPVGSSVAC